MVSIGLLTAGAQPISSQDSLLGSLERETTAILHNALPSVVTLKAMREGKQAPGAASLFHGGGAQTDPLSSFVAVSPIRQESVGSGFLVDEEGYVLTTSSVVQGASKAEATLYDGRTLSAKIVGVDDKTGLALLKIEAPGLKPLKLADSDQVEVGNWAIWIGTQSGFPYTPSFGMVSGKHRAMGVAQYEDFLQINGLVGPGSSGSPVLNSKGEVIGIVFAVSSPGTSVMHYYRPNIRIAPRGSAFTRPKTPAAPRSPVPSLKGAVPKKGSEIRIYRIEPGKGDQEVIVEEIRRQAEAEAAAAAQAIQLVVRPDQWRELNWSLEQLNPMAPTTGNLGLAIPINIAKQILPDLKKGHVPRAWMGVALAALDEAKVKELNLPSREGALVTSVISGSPAEKAGLKPNDVIVEFAGKPTTDPRSLQLMVAQSEIGQRVPLTVFRKGKKQTMEVVLAEMPNRSVALSGKTIEDIATSIDLNRPVSYSVQNATLSQALTELVKVSGISVMVELRGQIENKRISLEMRNTPLRNILDAISGAFGLSWRREGSVYIFSR